MTKQQKEILSFACNLINANIKKANLSFKDMIGLVKSLEKENKNDWYMPPYWFYCYKDNDLKGCLRYYQN